VTRRFLLPFLAVLLPLPAQAQFAVSVQDGKQVLEDGIQVVPARPGEDDAILVDFTGAAPRVIGRAPVPASVIGPPRSVAVTPDGRFAIVTSARRISSEDPTRIVADDRVTLLDLAGGAPAVVQTVHAGSGASGIAIDPAGRIALVANRAEGSVTMFAIEQGRLRAVTTLAVGELASSPAQPLFFDGGKRALVSRDGDHRIAVLAIEGETLRLLADTLAPGLRPYAIDTAGPRRYAVSGNIGGGGRDIDTISLIDLAPERPQVVDIAAAGLTPEGIKMSPDGGFVAATVNNGSNLPHASPTWHKTGILRIWRIADGRLTPVAEIPSGAWGQGIVWSRDGKWLLVQSMDAKRLERFAFDGRTLTAAGAIDLPVGPAAIATVEP